MGFYIVEALNGMGMHGAAIPPIILGKQMKVRPFLLSTKNCQT